MRRFLVAAAALALMVGRADAELALTFTSATSTGNIGDLTVGFSFTTTLAVNVAALDYILPGANGGNVRLYNAAGTTLASATVLATDPTESTGGFSYSVHALSSPLALAANTTYYVAGDIPDNHNNIPILATGVTTVPGITYGGGVLSSSGNPTTDAFGGGLNPAYFSVNFDLGPAVTAAPEPSTIALALSAVPVGIGVWLRRRRRAAA